MGIMSFKGTMLANLFKKPVTTKYPAEPIDFPEGSRGHIEIEIDKCISCTLCALNCPSGAIKVDRKARTWEINRMDCVQCGYCTMKCPKKCIIAYSITLEVACWLSMYFDSSMMR